MKFHPVCARAVIFAAGLLAGCNGQIGAGTGNPTGSGSGNSAGSGAGNTAGSGNTTGTAGASGSGNSAGVGATAGTGTPGSLDLSGNPKYYRVVRLSNTQWANAIQTVLNVPSGGLEQNFETAVTGTTDFSNNELVLGFDSRNWQDYQSAAESLALTS